jgi:hypothetical protein
VYNETKDFLTVQRDFTARLRYQGAGKLPENVSEERMQLYQRLNYTSINEIVKACFPVLTGLLPDAMWDAYMHDFLTHTSTKTPYFNRLPKAFVDYLETKKNQLAYPFLSELAHYEWLELYVDLIDESIENKMLKPDEKMLDSTLMFSPCAVMATYEYEVDQIGKSYLPVDKKPFSVVVYRDSDDEVKFMRINSMTHALLTLIREEGMTPQKAIEKLHGEYQTYDKAKFILFASDALTTLINAPVLVKK